MVRGEGGVLKIGKVLWAWGSNVVKQKDDGIFISQDKYVADILKKFDFIIVKTASTPIETNKDVDVHLYRLLIGSLMYLIASRPDIMFIVCACARDSPFDLEAFSDSDYAGASLDRKSTTGGCQFLGKRLSSWQCKKQTMVANSTTEAEYVAAANCCRHVLWIQNQMLDYGFNFMNTKIYIDNESTICIVKNLVFHSKTKHIKIRHHFIRDSYEKKLIQVIKIHTDHNVAGLLTKAFDVSRLNLLLHVLVYAARHTLTAVRHKLMLPGITYYCWFWATAKAKTVNGERQIQALVYKKKVIITEKSVRRDLMLDDAEGTECLPNDHLEGGVKFLMYPRFVQVFLDKQVEGMTRHKEVYVTPSHTKKVFANMKRPGKGFSRRVTPLFPTMMVQAPEDMGEDSAAPSDSHSTPIISQPSSSKPQKKNSRRKQKKDSGPTEPITDEAHTTPSYDPPQSGEDSMQLSELMNLCTSLQEKVLDLEKAKTTQAKEIASLKKRVNQLEKRRKLRTLGLKRLRKISSTSRVESSNDVGLGSQEDASKHGRKIVDLDVDAEVTLVDETQEMNEDNLMFDTGVLEEREIKFEKVVEEPVVSVATTTKSIPVSAADLVTTAGEVVTTASVEIPDELTLAQTLIEIKTVKPNPVTTAVTTVTSVRPKAKGIIFHDQEEQVPASTKTFSSSQSQLPKVKDKGKVKMVEPEKPLKKKDQVALDEEMARNLEAQMQAELIEEERLARKKEEEANIVLIESWDNTQAMMEADFELAQRLQAEEQGEITIEERSRLFVELMNRRKKHFAKLRAKEIRRKTPTKTQK
ncbi:hypothetical protein Tco_0348460 [Tanacetum coccineum]